MKIFVLNRGSSSIKCFLYEMEKSSNKLLWHAKLEWKNKFQKPVVKISSRNGKTYQGNVKARSTAKGLEHLLKFLWSGETAVITSFKEVDCIGHRIVQGGKYFKNSVLINANVKKKIQQLADLAPLHNLPELEGIKILEKIFKRKPQIAVFDTAFHHGLPDAAKIYPGPYKWVKEGIIRYGFHGISYQYCARRTEELLKQKPKKMVICHLGSGASLCALKDGKSIDTTMGFTPLEGLMMDTRSGTIDPGIIFYLLREKNKKPNQLFEALYYKSGLLGISGISSDMRDIIEKSQKGHTRSKLALELYVHRLNNLIGAMIASLEGLDVLVFTAGIGENAPLIRERVCSAFSFLGVALDKNKNDRASVDGEISLPHSKAKVLLVHTQEELEIARECLRAIS